MKRCTPFLFLILMTFQITYGQKVDLKTFESADGWTFIRADGVETRLNTEKGEQGSLLRFEYDFLKGTGYGGIQHLLPLDLPENYEFTFWLKAESPSNNFEIKFIDSTGHNVWWVNHRNFTFPGEWKKMKIRKRHIEFAWGPATDHLLRRTDRIEFTVASFVGGKGTLWLRDLTFEALPPETSDYPAPLATTSSFIPGHEAKLLTDGSSDGYWQSAAAESATVNIDFSSRREFGGLQIEWQKGMHARSFTVELSTDGKVWEKVHETVSNQLDRSFIRLSEAEARYLKLTLRGKADAKGFAIREISFPDVKSTLTLNDFLIYAARHTPRGSYPRYFSEEASFWTVTGVNNDTKEALINEDGMVEAEKATFSLEAVVRVGDTLYDWSKVKSVQHLGTTDVRNRFDFAPSVTRRFAGLELTTTATAAGEANKSSRLDLLHSMRNRSEKPITFEFFLLIRPFQVNPYYQFLNLPGGAGKIEEIRETAEGIVVGNNMVVPVSPFQEFRAMTFDEGNPVEMIRDGIKAGGKEAKDASGLASGWMKYTITLQPGEERRLWFLVPFHGKPVGALPSQAYLREEMQATSDFWREKTGHIRFRLPSSANPLIHTYHANLAYILINRDNAGIQPGSRSYERSWIRDGALTSSALLKSGIVPEVKEFINWYSAHQYENGKVPCVVDFRGPDPVPEHDSHGELIYLIREYFNFTNDTAFLREKNPIVLKTVDYIESLIAERSTGHFKNGNDSVRAYYGLVPESISHEGYSAKPMHSYWDNFFTMKGLKDAAEIQRIVGDKAAYTRVSALRDTFRKNLYNSLNLAMKTRGIDYVPGCVELGDFDATSTTIALTPCNELKNLPKPQIYNTFDKYYDFFKKRRDGGLDWVNYTPYENRLIGSFVILDQPERAHELIDFFMNDQRPKGWYHWAEVVWKDPRTPKFIGDIPHTWVGSDFINAFRSMFVYENEYDQSLDIAAALYQEWIDHPDGMAVENLPTYYGTISYEIFKEKDHYRFSITGNAQLPGNGIRIRNFNGAKPPAKIMLNGREVKKYSAREIWVPSIPAELKIYY